MFSVWKEGAPCRKVALLAVLVLLGILYYTYVLVQASASRERLLVLLWTPYFSRKVNWLRGCGRCDVTSDRALLPRARAIVLNWRNLVDPPPPTAPLVVLFNNEAPPHTFAATLRNLTVHWTATYRRDSDIRTAYGEIIERTEPYYEPALPANRSLVCWLVSNCNTPSGREEYVRQLEQYIDVHVYGNCGTRTCPYDDVSDCYKWLSERCQFHLSFENSVCRDYVTEKLFFALTTDMVPVVLGGEDYARYLPPDAVVDAMRFASPRALAEHLRALAADPAAYRRHLAWKRRWQSRPLSDEWLCTLCDRLQRYERPPPRTDLREWWFDGGHCRYKPLEDRLLRSIEEEGKLS